MPPESLPDWQLPPGVRRGTWDYLHDAQLARAYDARLAGTPLADIDIPFVDRYANPPGRAIDLGCGTGRLAVHLAQRGFEVFGVDLSLEMLQQARARATAAGVSVHLLQANLVDLRALKGAAFDVAACLFSTLGMIAGVEHRRQVLLEVGRLLKPGGCFVVHVHNWWFNLWDRAGRSWLLSDLWRSWRGHPEAGDRPMPTHHGLAGLALHHFTRGEIVRELRTVGLRILEVRPVSVGQDGCLRASWWLGGLRAYGYLIVAQKR